MSIEEMQQRRDVCQAVFPAHAGMNRQCPKASIAAFSVPRTRGDEPEMQWQSQSFLGVPRTRGDEPRTLIPLSVTSMCSPHTRG